MQRSDVPPHLPHPPKVHTDVPSQWLENSDPGADISSLRSGLYRLPGSILSSSKRFSIPNSGCPTIICPSSLNWQWRSPCAFSHRALSRTSSSSSVISLKRPAWIFVITVHCQSRKRHQIDPISIIQQIQIAVFCGDADHVADQRLIARCCPIHEISWVSPLDIHGMM